MKTLAVSVFGAMFAAPINLIGAMFRAIYLVYLRAALAGIRERQADLAHDMTYGYIHRLTELRHDEQFVRNAINRMERQQ
jgi:hypothetical protein